MAISGKVFNNEEELRIAIDKLSYKAMKRTMERMEKQLGRFIDEDIYCYDSQWYKYRRTDFLKKHYEDVFETYFWNDFGKGIKGAIRLHDDVNFPSDPEMFIHGSQTQNMYNSLNLQSFLEIMNNPDSIPSTRFNFPTNGEMGKKPFWDDFMKWAEDNFYEIFTEELSNIS